ncbi:MAG: restriction endonuclease subunit S [Lachnospiraceae bacterium]|nr:restriction endonuclease subunit S [Lachnospiraceae bacterium]
MGDNKRKPDIRFQGFTDDWEQRKVTELGEIYIGLVTTMTSHYTDHGALLIRNSDIKDGRFEFGDKPIYLDDEFAKQNASRKHKVGDVITVHTGDIGTSAVITEKEAGSIGFATIVTRPDKEKITSEYLCAYLNTDTHKNFAMNISTGDGRNNYNLKDYYECVVPVPSIAEQRKISSFIDELNNLITLQQRKYDKLVNVKKSMLEKMFPREGAKVPEIRFEGFTDDWEQRKLGECFTERKDSMPEGELISVTIGEGIKKFSELGRHDNSNDDKSKYKKVCVGDIAYNSMRMWQGASGYSPYEGIVSPAYTVLSPITDVVDSKCISYLFKRSDMTHVFQMNSQGITSDNWNLKYPALSEIEIMVSPYLAEQHKIAAYLSRIDNLITLQQRKLEKLKNIKKSMLEKMFV